MVQAILKTGRLTMVPLAPEHKDFLYELDSNPEVMKHIGYGKALDAKDSAIVHKLLMETASPGTGCGCWVGYSSNEPVGWWVLCSSQNEETPPKINKERAEFGLRIAPRFWGQGFAKEGSRELLKHGFQDLGIKEIFGDTMTVNAGSRATMSACGMKLIRTYFNQYDHPPAGIEQGEVEYRITLDEWLSLQDATRSAWRLGGFSSFEKNRDEEKRLSAVIPLGVAV